VTGPIEVVLWVATAALDTDFTAKLIDVYPPSQWYPLGYALNLTDTILRMRYRNGRDRAELAKPSELAPSVRHPDASLSSGDMFYLPGSRSTRAG
jgi:predicted acyl esterase